MHPGGNVGFQHLTRIVGLEELRVTHEAQDAASCPFVLILVVWPVLAPSRFLDSISPSRVIRPRLLLLDALMRARRSPPALLMSGRENTRN